jgi:bacteriophage N4 adsorption protein B
LGDFLELAISVIDLWVRTLSIPLAAYILLSGLDEVFIDSVCLMTWVANRLLYRPRDLAIEHAAVFASPAKKISILVPLWKESTVIRQMVDNNVGGITYPNYDFFLGCYPNDTETLEAVRELECRHKNVHVAVCGNPGPTSKADCLNWIYQRMLSYERDHDCRFEIIITHDAEDVIHPQALHWINYHCDVYDMVQVPVLPLRTPLREWTHGIYCDEFAEFQTKDMPGRQILGGFIPSNGVGTGFTRYSLEQLANRDGRIFEPECLTEDYENGLRLHFLGCPQLFMPVQMQDGEPIATREFFPHTAGTAIRQRTRWVTGIALQSWERHGWRGGIGTKYWLWRDRKGLIGNPVSLITMLISLYGLLTLAWSQWTGHVWGMTELTNSWPKLALFGSTASLQLIHLGVRAWCTSRIYGWRFASAVPLRALYANYINCRATFGAIWRYSYSKMSRTRLTWLKTDHSYPVLASSNRVRKLGEILVSSGRLSEQNLQWALQHQPAGVRLGEFLQRCHLLTEDQLYEALSLQGSIPLSRLDPHRVGRQVARSLPVHVIERHRMLPVQVSGGFLFVASPDLPDAAKQRELARYTRLTVRMQLLTRSNFDSLRRALL